MQRHDVLADYHSDEGQHVKIVARMRAKTGLRLADHGGQADTGTLEKSGRFESTTIEVMADGKLVESFPLLKDLASFTKKATRSILDEINALKDAQTPADEVAEELHSLLG